MAKSKDSSGSSKSPQDRTLRYEALKDLEVYKSGYDPDAYYVDSTDGKGHGKTLYTQVTPQFFRSLEVFRQENAEMYRTLGDLARDALYHGLAHLCLRQGRPVPSTVLWAGFNREMSEYQRAVEVAEASGRQSASLFCQLLAKGLERAAMDVLAQFRSCCQKDSDRSAAEAAWRSFVADAGATAKAYGVDLDPGAVPGGPSAG